MRSITVHNGFHATAEQYYSYAENNLKRALSTEKINSEDASILQEYMGEVSLNLCPQRVFKYYHILINWRNFIKPYSENTASDLFAGIEKLKLAKKPDGKNYSKNTISEYILFLKRFYLWLADNDYTSIPEKKLHKIKSPRNSTMTVTAESILSEEEILRMIKACWNTRDRAIVSMLYEGGFRISEIGTLQWKQIKFNQWNAVVNVNAKTDKPRYIPLVMSKPYLAQWKNDYPFEPEGDNHVFLSLEALEPIQYPGLRKKLTKISKRANIERKINPHLFRHSRITHLIQKGYNESVIKKMMWGNLTTNMFSTYAHLTDIDIDNEIAKHEGIITENKKEPSALEARQCPRCYTINSPTMYFCGSCGYELTKEAVMDKKEILNNLALLDKSQILELIEKAL